MSPKFSREVFLLLVNGIGSSGYLHEKTNTDLNFTSYTVVNSWA